METVLRAAIMFGFIWLIMRVIGRKELAGMSSFELVLLVVMGDLVQQGVTQQDTSVTAAVLAVTTMALIIVATSFVSFKFPKLSPVIEGSPAVIVHKGRLQRETLRIERLTEDEVREAAREQGIADLNDVAIGILESDGAFSFVTNSAMTRQQQVPQKKFEE
ncbi:MAG: DUF421 domain-containing protein [Actinomycetota bacterium]|nr:DUF421 domain-containing protein [Actinomycetota bacterium]